MCCHYYRVDLIRNSLREVSSVILICADLVVLVAVVKVEHNVTFIVTCSCLVEDSWFESEVGGESQAGGGGWVDLFC